MSHMDAPLLRKTEVGDRLNVSKRTVERLMKTGELKAVRINSRVTRITADSVEDYLKRIAA